MGANTIRLRGWKNDADHTDFLNKAYNNGVNPIYVIITFTMNPVLYPDISSPDARQKIKADFRAMVAACKDHPAVLMWSIGNGLNSPVMYGEKPGDLFSLIDEMAHEVHVEEGVDFHPVMTPLADIDLANTVAAFEPLTPDLDIWGANIHRGPSFDILFAEFKGLSKKPLLITAFGIDAYDQNQEEEYEEAGIPYQASFAESLWREILGNSDVCLGGVIRSYSDEWWLGKFGNTLGGCPDPDPALHSPCGYPSISDPDGFINDEWFGIMRIRKNDNGLDLVEPRKVYPTLKSFWAKGETVSQTPELQPKLEADGNKDKDIEGVFQSAENDWKTHKWEDALKKYKKVAEVDSPYASKAHIQIGKSYKYQGRWNEAIAQYEEAIKKSKKTRDTEDAETSIAAVHLSKGDYEKALSIFRNVISKTKDWQQVKYSAYWIKELKRRMSFGKDGAGCNTCGSSALKEIFKMKGIPYADEEVNRLLGRAGSGASMEEMRQLAEAKGLKAQGVKLSMGQLKESEMPMIALVENPEHYVIILGVEEGGLRIMDPENTNLPYLLPENEFAKRWKGYGLVFSEVKGEMITALLSAQEMKNLRGKVCSCCPLSDNGTQVPNVEYTRDCVASAILVNTVNLNMIYQATDLSYSGRGPGVQIKRTYNADSDAESAFGPGWTFNYNTTLSENINGSIDVTRETGTIHHFTSAGGGNYTPPLGIFDTLIKNGDGTYTLKLKGSKLTQGFNSSGRLTSITDKNGNSVTFQYDSNSRLVTITDAVNRVTTLNYGTNGKITSIADALGRTVSYSYDASDNLTSTTDMAGNTASYTYSPDSNYMTGITTLKGTTTIAYTTSSEGYALQSITDPLSNVRYYATYGTSHHVIRITDENGNPTDYENNTDAYTTKVTSPLGDSVIYEYDSGNRTKIKDPSGNATNLSYDTRGNVTGVTDPLGNSTQFTYGSNDNLTSLIDPKGNTYSYEYDEEDNLTQMTDPKNGLTIFTYNSTGELLTLKDAKNNQTSFTYDTYGNVITMASPLGKQDSYAYDAVAHLRLTTHTDPKQNARSYQYDGLNRVTKVTYQDASEKTYTYNCCGLSTVMDSIGTVTFTYDNRNRVTSFTDVYGKTISYGYDNVGNLTTLTYPGAKIVGYEYDNANRLVKVTDWLNNVTTYEYLDFRTFQG